MNKIIQLYKLAANSGRPSLYRIFSIFEIFCIILSFLTLVLLIVLIACRKFGADIPMWINGATTLLCAGSVGYLTNFIAVKMLFEPYNKKGFHWIKLLTFNSWKQGLIPANKNEIGRKMAFEIKDKLLTPESISAEVCEMISSKMKNPTIIATLKTELKTLFRDNKNTIIEFVIPKINDSVIHIINKSITSDNLKSFWDNVISNWLSEEKNREKTAAVIVKIISEKAPNLTDVAKKFLVEQIDSWSLTSLLNPIVLNACGSKFSDALVGFVNWKNIEASLAKKIGDSETKKMIKNELVGLSERLRRWLDEPSSQAEIQSVLSSIKCYLERFIGDYINVELPQIIDRLFDSEETWSWFENKAIPKLKKRLELWLKDKGRDMIIENFDIEEKIIKAVDKQDVREFQEMIDKVASEHLGAIQVLGFILGLFAGVLLMFAQP